MRKNEFRAWDKEKEVMIYSCRTFPLSKYKFEIDVMYNDGLILTELINRANITYDDDGEEGIINEFKKVDAIIMQYTGLEDEKGIRIYEGDIIPHHFNENIKGVVKLGEYKSPCDDKFTKHQGFYIDFYGELKDYYRKDLGYWASLSKVIGNVYENPQLLEGIENA